MSSVIEEMFEEYLKFQTDYAFLISGKWGSGKTYFYKNVLESKIKDISTYNDKTVGFPILGHL
ncbi:P-loop NTPase fold protein [Myroides odoratus]